MARRAPRGTSQLAAFPLQGVLGLPSPLPHAGRQLPLPPAVCFRLVFLSEGLGMLPLVLGLVHTKPSVEDLTGQTCGRGVGGCLASRSIVCAVHVANPLPFCGRTQAPVVHMMPDLPGWCISDRYASDSWEMAPILLSICIRHHSHGRSPG